MRRFCALLVLVLLLAVTASVPSVTAGADPVPATLSVGDTSLVEGNAGKQPAKLTVTLSAPQPVDTLVQWRTIDGTATTPDDYRRVDKSTRIRAGKTTATISVTVFGDTVDEPDETLHVELVGTDNPAVTLHRPVGTITIDNDDGPDAPSPGTPHLSIGTTTLMEGHTGKQSAKLTLTLSEPAPVDTLVHWQPLDGAATSPADYIGKPRTTRIRAGKTTAVASIPVHGELLPEIHEGFKVNLTGTDNPDLTTSDHHALVRILDDDNGPARGTPHDYTGDGRADRVWMTDDGIWHLEGSDEPLWISPDATHLSPTPTDYDGDGVWEAGVVVGPPDPDLTWISSSGISIPFSFGTRASTSCNRPLLVPGDYDADGRTDPAYYIPGQALWLIHGQTPITFGRPCLDSPSGEIDVTADIPVPADYDGDGDTDIATYNPVTAEWHVKEGGQSVQFGQPGDFPAPADYDGDGASELATLDTHSLLWRIDGMGELPAPSGAFGPLPADYDGDGLADLGALLEGAGGYGGDARWHVPDRHDLEIALLWGTMPNWLDANVLTLIFTKRCLVDPDCELPTL